MQGPGRVFKGRGGWARLGTFRVFPRPPRKRIYELVPGQGGSISGTSDKRLVRSTFLSLLLACCVDSSRRSCDPQMGGAGRDGFFRGKGAALRVVIIVSAFTSGAHIITLRPVRVPWTGLRLAQDGLVESSFGCFPFFFVACPD